MVSRERRTLTTRPPTSPTPSPASSKQPASAPRCWWASRSAAPLRWRSPLANVLFTAMLWPAAGTLVAHAGTKAVLKRVLAGGLHDPQKLPDDLVDDMYRSGSRPGHPRAFRSLCQQWHSWISARDQYPSISMPVTLAYGDHDWSRPPEREANRRAIPGAHTALLDGCGHFSSLEKPGEIAPLISQAR